MMKAKNCFFIEYPQMHSDKIKHGKLELHDYNMINPEWKLILQGDVLSIPEGFTYNYSQDIKIGDKIYFKYGVANEANIVIHEGKRYLRVDAFGVFAYVRNGQIHPFGDFSLTKAMYEDHDTVEVDGKEVKGQMSGSLFLVKEIKYDDRFTKIAYTKLKELVPGDVVVMDKHCDQKYTVEGREFFVIENRDIMAKYEA